MNYTHITSLLAFICVLVFPYCQAVNAASLTSARFSRPKITSSQQTEYASADRIESAAQQLLSPILSQQSAPSKPLMDSLFRHYLIPSDSLSIADMLSKLNSDSIRAMIQTLEGFGTRNYMASNHYQVAEWIRNKYKSFGFNDVQYDTFTYQGYKCQNIIATMPGVLDSTVIILIGGHYDSSAYGAPDYTAPGADDNATGTVMAMEIARILMAANYRPKYTIKFTAFDTEEGPIYGSRVMAQRCYETGKTIHLVINGDVLGYTDCAVQESRLRAYSISSFYRNLAETLLNKFTVLKGVLYPNSGSGPDDGSFSYYGYNNIGYLEAVLNPYMHTLEDRVNNMNEDYLLQTYRVSFASLLAASLMCRPPQYFQLSDPGNGSQIKLTLPGQWLHSNSGYKVSVGRAPGLYDSFYTFYDSVFVINGLQDGTCYYIGLSAEDSSGRASDAFEQQFVPMAAPRAVRLECEARWHSIYLKWTKATELDIAGYNVYRSTDSTAGFRRVNDQLLRDTVYVDDSPLSGVRYYYIVRAIDNSGLESAGSIVSSMPVSLDKGILLVDDSSPGEGQLANYSDEEIDNFYRTTLHDFRYDYLEIAVNNRIKLSDLGAYSTVVWLNDESPSTGGIDTSEIKKYIDFGGRFLFAGYAAGRLLGGAPAALTIFAPGSFFYDYLKISATFFSPAARFASARPAAAGLPALRVDSTKTTNTAPYFIQRVEKLQASEHGSNLYIYNSPYDSLSVYGSMHGVPVCVVSLEPVQRCMVLSVPLFFMKPEDASGFLRAALTRYFGEPLSVTEEITGTAESDALLQNYPNPFNPVTNIDFYILKRGFASLKVFDVTGAEVAVLFERIADPGRYRVSFNGAGLPSGVYIYKLANGGICKARKMIILK